MTFVPALNTVRIALEFTLGGEIIVNVVYGKKTTTVLQANLLDLITAVQGWWTGAKASFHTGMSLTAIRTRVLTTQAGLVEDYIYPTPEAGTVGGDAAPNNLAVVASFRTGLAGRSYRGRIYFAGFGESAYDENHLGTGYGAQFATIASDLGDAIESVPDFTHVVASFISNGAPRASAVLTPITQYVVNDRVDTQRRRLPKL